MFKEGPKSDRNNHRPISVLPIVSKMIEKIIFNKLYNYLTECNLLADSQHGFTPMHSTLTALLEATNDWYLNIDNGLLFSFGVPQGSVLGSLLFLIYINDLKVCPLSSYARMYANDTCLTASATDPEMLQFKLNNDLES